MIWATTRVLPVRATHDSLESNRTRSGGNVLSDVAGMGGASELKGCSSFVVDDRDWALQMMDWSSFKLVR